MSGQMMVIDEVSMKTYYYIKKKLFLYGDDTVVELVSINEEKVEERGERFFVTPLILTSTLREIPANNISGKMIAELNEKDLIESKKLIDESEAQKIVNLYSASQDDEFLLNLIKPNI